MFAVLDGKAEHLHRRHCTVGRISRRHIIALANRVEIVWNPSAMKLFV
jgi:hypothetical protein